MSKPKPRPHSHPGEELTFGCQACIEKVQRDQDEAARAEQPWREMTVSFRAVAVQHGDVIIEVQAMPGEKPREVADRYYDEIGQMIDEAVEFYDVDYDVDCTSVEMSEETVDAPRKRSDDRQLRLA